MSFGYTVNKEKNGVLLAYLAERIPNVTLRKLLKLVYLTDEKFTIERGFPLTWFNYFAWKKGPVAPEVYDVKNGSFADFVQCHRNSNDKYEVSPVGGALTEDRLNLYSRYEMNMIDEIISKYGSMSADELTDITHLENTLWSKVVNENKMMVNMTKEALYDFLLFHAYSKFSGFLVNILGLAVAFMGIFSYTTGRVSGIGAALYLVAAVIFLGGTPFQLKMRAKKQVVVNREYNAPVEYTFSEKGITLEQNGESKTYEWEQIERAVVTPKTIGIYYAPECAMILPKEDFGDQFVPIFTTIATQLGQSKVRMR